MSQNLIGLGRKMGEEVVELSFIPSAVSEPRWALRMSDD